MEIISSFNPDICKFKVYLVKTSTISTTNPMPLRKARTMIKERVRLGKYAELIQCFSCIEAKKFG